MSNQLIKDTRVSYVPGTYGTPSYPGIPASPAYTSYESQTVCQFGPTSTADGTWQWQQGTDYLGNPTGQYNYVFVPTPGTTSPFVVVSGNSYQCKTQQVPVYHPATAGSPPIYGTPGTPSQTTYDFNLGWNAGARSNGFIYSGDDGYVEWKVPYSLVGGVLGFNDADSDASYPNIEHAFYFSGKVARVYEMGVQVHFVGAYADGDLFRITRVAGVVTYKQNGTLVYTSGAASTGTVFLDSSLYSGGDYVFDPAIVTTSTPTVANQSVVSCATSMLPLNGQGGAASKAIVVWPPGVFPTTYTGNVSGVVTGTLIGGVLASGSFSGPLVDSTGALVGDVSAAPTAGTDPGTGFTGDFSGVIVDHTTGAVIGYVSGTLEGTGAGTTSYAASVTGDATYVLIPADAIGTTTGTVSSGVITGTVGADGTFTGTYTGTVTNPVNGDVIGTFVGTVTGTVNPDGSITGTYTGVVIDPITGIVIGIVIGAIDGDAGTGVLTPVGDGSSTYTTGTVTGPSTFIPEAPPTTIIVSTYGSSMGVLQPLFGDGGRLLAPPAFAIAAVALAPLISAGISLTGSVGGTGASSPGGVNPSAFLYDSFTGSGDLSTHVGETGAAWTLGSGAALTVLQLDGAGNLSVQTGSAETYAQSSGAPATQDYVIEAAGYIGATTETTLELSGVDNAISYLGWDFYLSVNLASGTFDVQLYVYGGATNPNQYITTSIPAGDFVVRLEVSPDGTMTVVLNGTVIYSFVEATLPPASTIVLTPYVIGVGPNNFTLDYLAGIAGASSPVMMPATSGGTSMLPLVGGISSDHAYAESRSVMLPMIGFGSAFEGNGNASMGEFLFANTRLNPVVEIVALMDESGLFTHVMAVQLVVSDTPPVSSPPGSGLPPPFQIGNGAALAMQDTMSVQRVLYALLPESALFNAFTPASGSAVSPPMTVTGTVTGTGTGTGTVSVTGTLTGTGTTIGSGTLTGTLTLTIGTVTGAITGTVTGTIGAGGVFTGTFVGTDAAGNLITGTVTGTVSNSTLAVPPTGPGSSAWVLNWDSAATTRYENYDFTSFAKIGDRYYGVKSDGIYVLEGDDDEGFKIRASASFGKLDFGTPNKKRVPHAYVGVSSGGTMYLRVTANGQTFTYAARRADADMRTQRIDLGKGLMANYLEFEIYNHDGCDFELNSVDFAYVELTRRI